ncbi:MAG: molybdopterin-dependent oxidoreductase [Nitrososphaerota archaeon]
MGVEISCLYIREVRLKIMVELPPGQMTAKRWNIYGALGTPKVNIDNWRLKISGCVDNPIELTYQDLLSLEQTKVRGGFHCVEGWSIIDVLWEGVKIKTIAEKVSYLQDSKWMIFRGVEGYSAPVPVEYALSEDSIIAIKMNGRPLPLEHGFPARPIIPRLYAWKSVKWLTEIVFNQTYVDGYWEARGYHPRGDVWLEERRK